MANKEEKEKNGAPKGVGAIITVVIAIVLIIVLLASFIFTIFQKIVDFIKGVISGVITGLLKFLAHPIRSTIKALGALGNWLSSTYNQDFNADLLEENQFAQLVEIGQTEFKEMRDAIDESISRDAVGLTDMMMKKMILAYNTGNYSRNTDIIIELLDDEKTGCTRKARTCSQGTKNCKSKHDENNPFCIVKGSDLEQLDINIFVTAASYVDQFFEGDDAKKEAIETERKEKESMQDKYYLYSKGVLKFVNEADEELVYYDEAALNNLFEEFNKNRFGAQSDYARSVWEYLSSKAYTDGTNGMMNMYSYEKVEEEYIRWEYKDNDRNWTDWYPNETITREIIDEYYIQREIEVFFGALGGGIIDTANKTYELQSIEYMPLVSKYTTSVEFMVDLLNISSSKDFVDAFINKVMNETEVVLKIYKIINAEGLTITEVTKEKTTVNLEVKDVTAKVTHIDLDKDLEGFQEYTDTDSSIIVTVEDIYDEWHDDIDLQINHNDIKARITVTNIPAEYEGIKLEVKIKDYVCTDKCEVAGSLTGDNLGNIKTFDYTLIHDGILNFTDVYKEKTITNGAEEDKRADITKTTHNLTTTSHLDIAVESAKTWYGEFKYSNYIEDKTIYQTKDSENGLPYVISSVLDVREITDVKKYENSNTITYTRSSASDPIFNEESKESNLQWKQVGNDIQGWYSRLTANEYSYWVTGGPLTNDIYNLLQEDDGHKLSNEDDILNVKFIFAMEANFNDDLIKSIYTPVSMTCEATKYIKSYLYATYTEELISNTLEEAEEKPEIFLSLLKQDNRDNSNYDTDKNDGITKYNPNESYSASGDDVVYNTVYNTEDRVGKFFINGAEMLLELLRSSDNTRLLADVMKVILNAYAENKVIYTDADFNFYTFAKDEFESIDANLYIKKDHELTKINKN